MTHRTKEICQQEALKYQTKREFNLADHNTYRFALRYGYLDEICKHMITLGNKYKRCVYSYEFPDNHVYVGITYDFNKRKKDRETRSNDTVTQYINKTGLIPVHKQLTDYIKINEAVLLEGEFVKEYEKHNWHILNKIKTGSVGATTLYWTKERCLTEGLKYTRRSDFSHKSKGAYDSCRRNGWLQEIYLHMKPVSNLYWTKELCIRKALLCDTRTEFRKKYMGAYLSAKRHNWLNEICKHMISKKSIWTLKLCIIDAKNYKYRTDWSKNNNIAYNIARTNKWLDKCCKHMKRKPCSNNYKRKWTEEKCLTSALTCESFIQWRTKDRNAYMIARKYGWFENCTKHMKSYK
jgi:hypothetical protein